MLQDGVTEIVKLENFSIFPPETGGWPVTAETWHDCGRELINFHKIRKGLQSDPEDWVEARKHCAAGDGQIDFIQSSETTARMYIRALVLFLIRFSFITVHCLRFTVIVSTQSEKHLPCYESSGASLNNQRNVPHYGQTHLNIVEQLPLPPSDIGELIPLLQGQILRHWKTQDGRERRKRKRSHHSWLQKSAVNTIKDPGTVKIRHLFYF